MAFLIPQLAAGFFLRAGKTIRYLKKCIFPL
jgi:hypothetical protein